MAIKLLPFDPATLLLESMARVIREGIANCDTITAPDNVAWTEGQTSPEEHYLAPAGYSLYVDREPEEVATPAIILTIPEDAKEKSASLDGLWSLAPQVQVIVDRDSDIDALESLLQRLQLVLTSPVILNDTTVQLAQARLSTATLKLFGLRRDENFEATATGKMTSMEGHPQRLLAFSVTCSRIASS